MAARSKRPRAHFARTVQLEERPEVSIVVHRRIRPVVQPSPDPYPTSKYRSGQTYLFHAPGSLYEPDRIGYNTPLYRDGTNVSSLHPTPYMAPNYDYIDMNCGWPWDRKTGDFIDYTRARNPSAPTHWISQQLTAGAAPRSYTVSGARITEALQFIQTGNRWCAWLVQISGTARIAGWNSLNRPSITVIYTDTTQATLACRVTSKTAQDSYPHALDAEYAGPFVMEFERPTKQVSSATMTFYVTSQTATPTVNINPIDPRLNTDPYQLGVADGYSNDVGLAGHSSIIGVQQYLDGTTLSQFADYTVTTNTFSEALFDPAIYRNELDGMQVAPDLTKLPHSHLNKWVGRQPSEAGGDYCPYDIVPSTYTGENFSPLAPGIGAFRVKMEPRPGITDGYAFSDVSWSSLVLQMFLPAALWRTRELFVRYYMRFTAPGEPLPYRMPIAKDWELLLNGTTPRWSSCGGKTGISPSHETSWGGGSGTSGGGKGWQMRLGWTDVPNAAADYRDGPDFGGWSMDARGLYDFQWNNPPGFGTGSEVAAFGQRGGLGGMLYADQWYCIEEQIKLNSVRDAQGNIIGALPANAMLGGFLPDGEVRVWIDGHLCYERTGLVLRTLPYQFGTVYQPSGVVWVSHVQDPNNVAFNVPAYNANARRPCCDLGIHSLYFNVYHGGQTPNGFARTKFISQLAYGTSYIGPMRTTQVAPTLPDWLDGQPLNTWVAVPNSTMATDMVDFQVQYEQGLSLYAVVTNPADGYGSIYRDNDPTVGSERYELGHPSRDIEENSGSSLRVANSALLAYGGGGAGAWCGNDVRALVLENDTADMKWKTLNRPTRIEEIWWKREIAYAVTGGSEFNPRYGYYKDYADGITPELTNSEGGHYPGPVQRHTYWNVHHHADSDRVFTVKAGAICPADLYEIQTTDSMPLDNVNWTDPHLTYDDVKWDSPFMPNGSGGFTTQRRHALAVADTPVNMGPITAQCMDPVTGMIYYASSDRIYRFDPRNADGATSTWQKFYDWWGGENPPSPNFENCCMTFDTKRNLLVCFFVKRTAGVQSDWLTVYVFDPTKTPAEQPVRLPNATISDAVGGTLTGKIYWSGSYPDLPGYAVVYAEDLDRFIVCLDEINSHSPNNDINSSGTTLQLYSLEWTSSTALQMENFACSPPTTGRGPIFGDSWARDGWARSAVRSNIKWVPNLKGIMYWPSSRLPVYFLRTS